MTKALDARFARNEYYNSLVDESIGLLPQQIDDAFKGASKIRRPRGNFDHILFCGMGGSNLASELIRSIYKDEIKKPINLVRHYNLPACVGKNTLVFICSYSGNTEETVSCLKQAIKKEAKIICLSTGGKVISLAKKNKLAYYKLPTKSNPSNQPRYGLGLQLGAILGLFNKLKLIKIKPKEIKDLVEHLKTLKNLFGVEILQNKNLAKSLASSFKGYMPILVASGFLSANVHILANQINESAKVFATGFAIPELNHHLMEGLSRPKAVKKKMKFLFFKSVSQDPKIIKRFAITQKVLAKQRIRFLEYEIEGDGKLITALEILIFGSWFSFYLAVLNHQNPSRIPYVDYFKEEMKA